MCGKYSKSYNLVKLSVFKGWQKAQSGIRLGCVLFLNIKPPFSVWKDYSFLLNKSYASYFYFYTDKPTPCPFRPSQNSCHHVPYKFSFSTPPTLAFSTQMVEDWLLIGGNTVFQWKSGQQLPSHNWCSWGLYGSPPFFPLGCMLLGPAPGCIFLKAA